MTDFFADEAPAEDDLPEYDADRPSGSRRPLWVTASVIVSALLCLALLPGVIVLLFPPFAVYFLEFARLVAWASPILIVGNVLSLVWGFPRKRPVVTAMSMLGLLIAVISVVLAFYAAAGGQDPVSILGIPVGPFGGGESTTETP